MRNNDDSNDELAKPYIQCMYMIYDMYNCEKGYNIDNNQLCLILSRTSLYFKAEVL